MVRGAGCRESKPRLRRREKNVLDMPLYRSAHIVSNPDLGLLCGIPESETHSSKRGLSGAPNRGRVTCEMAISGQTIARSLVWARELKVREQKGAPIYVARTIDTCLLGSAHRVLEHQRPLKQARGRAPKLGQQVRQVASLAGLHPAGCGMGASVWLGGDTA